MRQMRKPAALRTTMPGTKSPPPGSFVWISGRTGGRCPQCGARPGRWGGGLLVARGDASPLLQAVDAPLDGVALLVGLSVEGWWPAASAAPTEPVAALVWGGDHCPDAALAQVLADRAGGVRLAGQAQVRPRARPSSPTGTRRRAMSSVKACASPACPAVRPPRELPMAWLSGSPAGAPLLRDGRPAATPLWCPVRE